MEIARFVLVTVQRQDAVSRSRGSAGKELKGKDVALNMLSMSCSVHRLLHLCQSPSRRQGVGVVLTIRGVETRVMSSSR